MSGVSTSCRDGSSRSTSPSRATDAAPGRDRDADLLNAGFSTLRITNQRLKHNATKEARRLREILSR